MNHIIQKQLIELELKPGNDVFRMQQQMSEYYKNRILPELEKIFDKLAGENELLKLDKLVIDLGMIKLADGGTEFSIEDLSSILSRQISSFIKEKQFRDRNQEGNTGTGEVTVILLVVNAVEQWLHYIQTGLLPWNVSETGSEWKLQVLEGLATEFYLVTKLRETIRSNERAIKRIIRDHPESFLVKLIEVLTAREQKDLPAFIQELKLFIEILNQQEQRNHLKERKVLPGNIWKQILELAAAKGSGTSSLNIAEELIAAVTKDDRIVSIHQALINQEFNLLKSVIENLLVMKKTNDQKKSNNERTENKNDNERKENLQRESPGDMEEPVDELHQEETGSEIKLVETRVNKELVSTEILNSSVEAIPEEGIFVTHAGLLLLHPFFRFLFKNVSFTHEGKFIDREKQEKSILLLNYIASGKKESEDHQLVVPKTICSWPLDEPLNIETTLSEQEAIEADDLIRVAISQWDIIKNTSADGLREGFLQRKGKIYSKNGHVHIQVEKSAIDVLLDHLPWNLSIVKLPWLENLIYVEWR